MTMHIERNIRDRLRSYVTLDGIDYPLVPGSEVMGAPLNPFSPASQAGNSSRIASQRHAVRVWDDFTQGIGHLNDNEEHGGYAFGNLDARRPNELTLPTASAASGTTSGFAGSVLPVHAECLITGVGQYTFLCWTTPITGNTASVVKTIKGTNVNNVALTSANEQVQGVAPFIDGVYYMLTYDPVTLVSRLYQINAFNTVTGALTYALWATFAAVRYMGLVYFDSKLITYDVTNKVTKQYDTATTTFVAFDTGAVLPKAAFGDQLYQLFVWTDKTGSRDALYALTALRIMVYDEDGQQWEVFYDFSQLWPAAYGFCHVNRRDNSLIFVPTNQPELSTGTLNDAILIFSPGTVDNITPNAERGLPSDVQYAGVVGRMGHMMAAPVILASNTHHLYAFSYAPAVGSTTGIGGGVFARNKEGGWTQVFDSKVANGGSFSPIIGGGVGANRMVVFTADQHWWDLSFPDHDISHPFGSYETNRTYFLQSGRVYNSQRNTYKLASHFEVALANNIPATSDIRLAYVPVTTDATLVWVSPANNIFLPNTRLARVDVSNNVPYLYLQWRLTIVDTAGTSPAVVESVALYYTYWQENHFAYSFTIDLSAETWAREYPDGNFHGRSRDWLQAQLLTLIDQKSYHTFAYNRFNMRESVGRVDVLLSRREMADNGGGLYPMTARDLEA